MIETIWDVGSLVVSGGLIGYDIYELAATDKGLWSNVGTSTAALAIDIAATFIPFVPGGAGFALKTQRAITAAKAGAEVLKAGNNFVRGYYGKDAGGKTKGLLGGIREMTSGAIGQGAGKLTNKIVKTLPNNYYLQKLGSHLTDANVEHAEMLTDKLSGEITKRIFDKIIPWPDK